MNAYTRVFAGFFALLAGSVHGADVKVRVQGSADLRLAVVDSSRASAARDALHEAFATSLADAINSEGGSPVGVKVKCVNPDHAAFNLGTGVYDAVLVIAPTLPRPLILSGTTRLMATLGAGKAERKAVLIFNENDPGLATVLKAAFTPALTDNRFLDAFDGGLEQMALKDGEKVASNP